MNENEFWAILSAPAIEAPPVIYRLYHDELGQPLFFSMEDLPGNYIELTEQEFNNCPSNVKVVDGKLKIIRAATTTKLAPSDTGFTCDPRDICVVVDESKKHIKWSLQSDNND